MRDYAKIMIEEFLQECLKGINTQTPWDTNLFKIRENQILLNKSMKEQFHHSTYQALFLCKRRCPNIMTRVAFLTTRVTEPTQEDWKKLIKMMKFLNQTKDDILTLEAKNLEIANWHTDIAFAVHPDFRSHTGMNLSFGKGTVTGVS